MARTRRDEILGKALPSDSVVIPRYDLIKPDGSKLAENVELTLKNPVVAVGTEVDKVTIDECLAASGVVAGTKEVLTLNQTNFALFDGARVQFKLSKQLGPMPTLNVNNTGAKKLMQDSHKPAKAGLQAGTWLTAVYSSTFDFFLLQGNGGDARKRSTWQKLLTNTMNVRGW